MLYLYNEINNENLEIEIQYKPDNTNKESEKKEMLKIFSKKFISKNFGKCKIIYKNKEYDLCEYINDIDNKYYINDIIKIKLKGYNNITDLSYMFYNCNKLSSLSDISKWNTSNVNNMRSMFNNCTALYSLPYISKWNTSNVKYMNYIFSGCKIGLNIPPKFKN